jgi:hypothetical protein
MTDEEWAAYNRIGAEYNAKAAMIGMNYNPMGHYFFELSKLPADRVRYDADTMEEIPQDEATNRRDEDYGPNVLRKKARTHAAQFVTSGGNDDD